MDESWKKDIDQSLADCFDLERCGVIHAPSKPCLHRGHLSTDLSHIRCSRCGAEWEATATTHPQDEEVFKNLKL